MAHDAPSAGVNEKFSDGTVPCAERAEQLTKVQACTSGAHVEGAYWRGYVNENVMI